MSAPRFLLINPWIHDFTAFDLWSRPLGFLSLYSYLRDNGCVVDYVDALHLDPDTAEQWGLEMPERRSNGTGEYYSERIAKPDAYAHIPRYYRRFGLPPAVLRGRLQELPQPDAILVTSGMSYCIPVWSPPWNFSTMFFRTLPATSAGRTRRCARNMQGKPLMWTASFRGHGRPS